MKYDVLNLFSEEARAAAASRVYDQERSTSWGTSRACANGLCIMGVLMHTDYLLYLSGLPVEDAAFPTPHLVLEALEDAGILVNEEDRNHYENELDEIIPLNDQGGLATPEAVAALFAED